MTRFVAHVRGRRAPRADALLAVVIHNLDVVAIGVEDVRGVVAIVVAGPLTRLAVASVSGRDRVCVEPAYVVVPAREGDMSVGCRFAGDEEQGAVCCADGERGAIMGLAPEREAGGTADRRVERG